MRKKLMTGICTLAMVLALGACGDGKSPAEDAGKENPVVTEQPSEGQEDAESDVDATDKEDEMSDNKGEVESTDQKDEEPVPEVTPEVTEPAPKVTPEVTEPVDTDGTIGEVNVGKWLCSVLMSRTVIRTSTGVAGNVH